MEGLKVSTRRTSVAGPKVVTRGAIARGSRSGAGGVNPQPQKKRSRQPLQPQKKRSRQPSKKVEDVADEVLTPGWEARGARPDQGRGSQVEPSGFDVPDVKNVQAVVPYLIEIHQHYRETEGLKHASPSYMSKHADINARMRSILIDWLVEVHLKFKLMPETLYLTVNLIDRFLEKEQSIMREKLQLVGVTAMFMASKYEEIYAPECRDFVYISDKAYTRDEILRMEGLMLARLNFQLTAPNAFVFVKRFAKVAGIATTPRSTTELLANYLVELTLQDYKMLKYLPSTICASAVYLALKTSGQTPWTPDLEKHSTYKEADLQACARDIHELHDKATTNSLQAVRKKYTQEKHGNVSSIKLAHFTL